MTMISPDNKSFAQLAEYGIKQELISVNEFRGLLGLEPIGNGDCTQFEFVKQKNSVRH